jgi:uncharacterized oxidoreductase
MLLKNRTILITGGSSGIGLELARQLFLKDNTVIVCGRSREKLEAAKRELPAVHIFQCDVAMEEDRSQLFEYLLKNHPTLDVLINNAALVHKTSFAQDASMISKARLEIDVNLFAPIVLSKMFLDAFGTSADQTIVNITTGLVYAPRAVYPIYNATKAGLHAFTQVLRQQLKTRNVRVVEVMMPVVDTPWHEGRAPKVAITPEAAVKETISKLERGETTLRIGKVRLLYLVSRLSPKLAFRMINGIS